MKADFPQTVIDLHLKLKEKSGLSYSKQMASKMSKEDADWMADKHLTPAKIRWMLLNGVNEIPVCPVCGKDVAFEKGRTYCSNKCRSSDPNVLQKIEQTNLERYGSKSAIQSESIKTKIKQSNLEKYGSEWPFSSEVVREKIQTTWQKKYGTDHPMHSEEIRQKRRDSCIKNFGAPSPFHSDEVRGKIKQTCIERYGSECSLQNPDIREKAEQTCIERYGCRCSLQNPEIREKAAETMTKLYGSEYSFTSETLKAKCLKTMKERYGADNPSKKESSLYSSVLKARIESVKKKNYAVNAKALSKMFIEIATPESEYPYVDSVRYRCRQCGAEFESEWRNSELVRCPSCARKNWSRKEKQIVKFIASIYSGIVVENDRNVLDGKELDILVPDKNLAIEFNGSYWHSSAVKDKNFHLMKTKACAEKGIRLIHVFEWEWDMHRGAVESIIRQALGLQQRCIGARKCSCRSLSQPEYKSFLEENHLQGSIASSSIRLGLFYNGELLMCAGWGKSRFNENAVELHRICTKNGARIVGGLSKLISHSGLDCFFTYVDLAHFTGDGYRKTGFAEIGSTRPGYKWTKAGMAISRQQAQKSRLPKLLGEAYNPELTEVENMAANGWLRIFDCGSLKMEWRKKTRDA